jgi:AraC-like DNA-binding protein
MITARTFWFSPLPGAATEVASEGYWSANRHRHEASDDLNLCLDGTVRHTVNGVTITQTSGDIVWVRDGDDHHAEGKGFRFINIDVPSSVIPLIADGLGMRTRYHDLMGQPSSPCIHSGECFDAIKQKSQAFLHRQFEENASLYLRNLLNEMLLGFFIHRPPVTQGPPAWLERVAAHIENHLSEVYAGDLPAVCGCSAAHLSRSFKAAYGESPSRYINRLRIERAAIRLAASNDDISRICYDVGFNSLSYFYRLFSAIKEETPLSFRAGQNPYV